MQKVNAEKVRAGVHGKDHPFATAVAESMEEGMMVSSILRANLAKAGYKIIEDVKEHAEDGFRPLKHLHRVLVKDESGNVIAMGASDTVNSALKHAVLGWVRENQDSASGVITLLSH